MDFHVHQSYRVMGMSCAACAHSVSSLLSSQPGVVSADVHYGTQTASVSFQSTQTSTETLRTGLQLFGYDILPLVRENEAEIERRDQERRRSLRRRAIVGILLCIPLIVLGMDMQASFASILVQSVLTLVVLVVSGRDFFVHAYQQARRGTVSMDTLVALSTGLAFGWSMVVMWASSWLHSVGIHAHVFFESAAVIVATVLIGKVVEENAKHRARGATAAVHGMFPSMVHCRRDGTDVDLPIDDIRSGDMLRIFAGERMPVDGVIRSGESYVDESFLTGESAPVAKGPSDAVYAGTLNHDGVIVVEARSIGDDTMIRSIERAVRAAQDTHVAAQRFVDFVSSVFVPVILGVSALTFAVWCFLGGTAALPTALASAITVLIVACPCALGLAAPIALVVGIQRAATKGILVKDAQALEIAAKVTDVVFDKTGTLSDGETVRVEIRPTATGDFSPLEGVLFSVESASRHPHAQAVVRELKERGALMNDAVADIREVPGQGVMGTWKDSRVLVGSAGFLREHGVVIPDGLEDATFLYAVADRVVGSVVLRYEISGHAVDVVSALRARGIRTHILSGDTQEAVERAAAEARMDAVRWRCTPEEKESYIRELQSGGAVVAMVGDGMNDAQSLARADVSIAMGRGSDIAQQAAQFVLVGSDIRNVNAALGLARRTMSVVRQNLAWAFVYNILLIPLATGFFDEATGMHLDPMMAGIAMALSSVSVVTNSLRLRRA